MAEYCTLDEVRARLPELGTSDDPVLSSLITAVSAYFDGETESRFDSESMVQVFTGTGTKQLFIRPPLASAPTQVRIRDNAQAAWRVVPIADVKLMPEGRRTGEPIRWLELLDVTTGPDHYWPKADSTAEITGPFGRATVPDDLREGAIQTVVNLYRSRGSAGSDMEVGVGGTYMPAIVKAIPHFAWSVLQNYRRLVIV